PFRDAGADLILRSSDGVEFHVYRAVLWLLSPVFRDMFTLPQPDSEPKVPDVRMPESGVVLHRVLRFCYPGAEPIVQTLGQLAEILEILVQRYDMKSMVPLGQVYLSRYIESDPLGSFAVAARHNWEGLVSSAAKKCLELPLRAPNYKAPEELKYISGTTYHCLIRYHHLAAEAVGRAAEHFKWI
ncbi:hypothetical protein B0H17DRAFT_894613, partial [Mycena rosella]